MSRQISLTCTPAGQVIEVLLDDVGLGDVVSGGVPLAAALEVGSIARGLSMLADIRQGRPVVSCQLNLRLPEPAQMFFTGGMVDGLVVLFGTERDRGIDDIVGELMSMNNAHVNQLRALLGAHRDSACQQDLGRDDLMEAMTRLNNDMSNLQRRLSQRNKELEELSLRLREERERSESLLRNILPATVAARLKAGEDHIADRFEEVTVLFSDLVGFTPLAQDLDPRELVGLLDDITRAFDALAGAHRLEKIKTIGDAYMLAGGLDGDDPGHADRVLRMALDMSGALARINAARGSALQLRVGMCTGPVVAGVIGARKFAYDLWGDTVNVAARMESHGVPGAIQLPDSTVRALRCAWPLEDRGMVEIKGKGRMRTWLLRPSPEATAAARVSLPGSARPGSSSPHR